MTSFIWLFKKYCDKTPNIFNSHLRIDEQIINIQLLRLSKFMYIIHTGPWYTYKDKNSQIVS